MLTKITSTHLSKCDVAEEQIWYELYHWLLPCVETWVRNSRVSSWHGQQREIAEDISHETIMRTLRYSQRADRGEVAPILSLKALSRVIACNYFRDCRKKDQYLVRPAIDGGDYFNFCAASVSWEMIDVAQIVLDRLMLDSIIVNIAQAIARFPPGQKKALLTDLANMSDLSGKQSSLEQALLHVGLQLSDYKRPRPNDPVVRGRDAALRSIAYKRLRQEIKIASSK